MMKCEMEWKIASGSWQEKKTKKYKTKKTKKLIIVVIPIL